MASHDTNTNEDHAMPASEESQAAADDAIDDSSEVDGDFVQLQRSMSQKRRQPLTQTRQGNSKFRTEQILGFQFLPLIRPLSISDFESCVALENAAFPKPEHRASPEKFEYRLTTCPELSLGLFCTVVPGQEKGFNGETLATAKPVETDRADGALSVLLAHAVSTRSCSEIVTDADMDYPKDWRTQGGKSAAVGNQEKGRTVALHSVAVSPKLHGCGLGKTLMMAYLQRLRDSGLADRVSLLCQDYLVSYYERFGFKSKGESKATFGGGGWHDMVCELPPPDTPSQMRPS